LRILAFILLSNLCLGQPLLITVKITKIPTNLVDSVQHSTERVMIVFEKGNLGFITWEDTLALIPVAQDVFIDILHQDQAYYLTFVQDIKGNFAFFLAPLKPYRRKLYSIIIKSL